MDQTKKIITLPCDCGCCMFVIEKATFENSSPSYNISVQDSRYDWNYNTLRGRISRAIKTLFGKPIYYNGLWIESEERFQKFIDQLISLTQEKV